MRILINIIKEKTLKIPAIICKTRRGQNIIGSNNSNIADYGMGTSKEQLRRKGTFNNLFQEFFDKMFRLGIFVAKIQFVRRCK